MKFVISVMFILIFQVGKAQKEDAFLYSFNSTINYTFDSIIEISTPISFSGELLSLKKDNYRILIIKNDQPESNFNFNIDQIYDTLIFDLTYKKVYTFSEKNGMYFSLQVYKPGETNIYIKNDATIRFSLKIPKDATPFAVLIKPEKGIESYVNKKSSFHYKGKKQIEIDLDGLITRYKSFPFVEKFMPNIF